jgi:pimeloyl-ACP methyl ester carboxylesterase
MRHVLVLLTLAACQAAPSTPVKTASPNGPPRPAVPAPEANQATTPQIVRAVEGQPTEIWQGAPHVARAVEVGNRAVLEVLDWGGNGPPIVLLAGLGNSAHVFDDLASAFIDHWRVLGISRRGFGASTATPDGYDVPNLGADILRVLDALSLPQAIFIGHSVAGEELTWLGSEHADRALALVYLDAAYDRVALRDHFPPPTPEPPTTPADLASPTSYAAYMARGMGMTVPVDEVLASFAFEPDGHFLGIRLDKKVVQKVASAVRVPDYGRVKPPTLALYSLADHWTADYAAFTAREREKLARALPTARVLAIPHAKHYLFLTHRAEVVREIHGFLGGLQHPAPNLPSE